MKSNDLTEPTIVDSFRNLVDKSSHNLLGWNEDAVAIHVPEGFLVLNTDSWVSSTDRPKDMSYFDCGYRALVNSASDIVAKGVLPEYAVISLSIPKKNRNHALEIIKGAVKACEDNDLYYLGGDLNSANDLVIDVTAWGFTKNSPIKRSGAQIGDHVYWLGPELGEINAALGILLKKWDGDKAKAMKIFGQPKLWREFIGFQASSSIDSSDGIAKSLHFICDMSGVGMEIDDFKISEWAQSIAKKNEIDIFNMIFYGGEELGILFTSTQTMETTPYLQRIGKVVSGNKITQLGRVIENKGWDHFRN